MMVIFEKLSKRQQAYVEVCKRFGITIGDDSYSGGEDAGLYFAVLIDENVECAPEREVMRYCVVTVHGDHYYAFPDCDTLREAKRAAIANASDDLYYELPEEIINLDTGKRYMAAITAKWVEA